MTPRELAIMLHRRGWTPAPGVSFPQEPALRLDAADPCWGCGRPIGRWRISLLCRDCMSARVQAADVGEVVGMPRASDFRKSKPRRAGLRRRYAA